MKLIKRIIMLLNREIPTEVLIRRGMKVGKNFNRQQGCFIDPTHCYLITIGDDVTMSVRVTILAHDASMKKLSGYTRIGQVHIGDKVFLGANSTVLPGVTIGDNVVVGAGSVVTRDVQANSVVAGVPAKVICTTDEFSRKVNEQMAASGKIFDATYRMGRMLSEEKIDEMIQVTNSGFAYID